MLIKVQEVVRDEALRKVLGHFHRSRESFYLPGGIVVPDLNVRAKLVHRGLEHLPVIIPGGNLVTNDGDLYYAQQAASETPTNDFDSNANRRFTLGTSGTAPAKTDKGVGTSVSGSGKVQSSGYPKTNDTDTDNTGKATDSITWKVAYTTAEANANGIAEVAFGIDGNANGLIVNADSADIALFHALFAATFNKTSSDTLTVWVNHNYLGV